MKKQKYLCCVWCGKDIPKEKKLAKYCSKKCRYEAMHGRKELEKAKYVFDEALKTI